ncbi:MAG: DUF1998 domain-containing protein, partial [Planctomycetes bacterium]|nr:DUF1998 domain-containing protein [Planctomycetota bacterium]
MSSDTLRSSQVILTFGPGAMLDLPNSSVLVAGLEHWHYDKTRLAEAVIEEPRLLGKLRQVLGEGLLGLRRPPAALEREHGEGFRPGIDAWRFPEWFIVQNTVVTPGGFWRRRLVHLEALDGKERLRFRERGTEAHEVVPVRFVRACRHGHVGDIDWIAFVHGASLPCGRDLWMENRGSGDDLLELWVVCECGAQRSMTQAERRELSALGRCNGSRPWLGPGTKERCGEPNWLLIRSASNAYFPQPLSVISIPDRRSPLDDLVRSLWDDFLSDVEDAAGLAKMLVKPTVKARLGDQAPAEVLAAIGRVRTAVGSGGSGGAGGGPDRPVKEVEFEALGEAPEEVGADEPGGDFHARALPRAAWAQPWMAGIERVVLAHRLREVVAQVGFTRFEAAGPDTQGELSVAAQRAPLGLEVSWLPAVEHRGEGVFLKWERAAIEAWLGREAVRERGRRLEAGFAQWQAEHKGSTRVFPGVTYYLLHTFSHLLLTAISLECGYPASSLRERVYAGELGWGVLIYTGSS